MAIVACAECKREISSDAIACPHCGKPQRSAVNRKQDNGQRVGCALMVVALVASAFSGTIALTIFIVGLIVAAINTRFY